MISKNLLLLLKSVGSLEVSPSLISYYIKIGVVERVSRGVYRNPNLEIIAPFEWQDLLEVAQSVPNGTICLVSALTYYDLTLLSLRNVG